MADDKREHGKPAAPPPAGAAAPSPPGSKGLAAVKQELTKRGLDDEDGGKGKAKHDSEIALSPAERAMSRLGRALMLLSAVILLFVISGAALIYFQLNMMRSQLDVMKAAGERNEQAIAAAGRIADAAKKSADAIPDVERAYLFADASALALPKTIVAGTPARIAFKNYGKTPAILNGVGARYYYVAGQPVRLELPKTKTPAAWVIGDGGEAGPYDLPLDANDQDLANARKNVGAVLVQAVMAYSDIFGEQHETGLCYAFNFAAEAFVPCSDGELTYHN